jgi:hypothetical protein
MIEFSRRTIVLILAAGILVGAVAGLVIGWVVWPVEFFSTDLSDLRTQYKDDYVVMVGSAYALDGNLDRAKERLDKLNTPNIVQFVNVLADRYIAEGRSLNDVRSLAILTKGLGGDTTRLAMYLATATPTVTLTFTPSATATSTPKPTLTPTPVPTNTMPPTNTPVPPTATPVPPTNTPIPPTATRTRVPATATPVPVAQPAAPTSTAAPTAPPNPTGAYVIKSFRLRPVGQDAQHCASGDHNIWVFVEDAAGNRIDGVRVRERFTGQIRVTGQKGPGIAQYDIFSGGGGQVQLIDDAGNAISPESRGMSDDWPDFDLMKAAGYCNCKPHPDDASCQADLASHQYLFARGHYVYEVVYMRQ